MVVTNYLGGWITVAEVGWNESEELLYSHLIFLEFPNGSKEEEWNMTVKTSKKLPQKRQAVAAGKQPLVVKDRPLDKFVRVVQDASSVPHSYLILLGMKPEPSIKKLGEEIKKGFPFKAFEDFQRVMELPAKEVASLIGMPMSTLARRKEKGHLAADESERLLRLSRLVGLTVELFEGDDKAARHWLSTPKRALDGASPLQIAETEPGAREVEKLIDRLEHGVFS